MKVEVRNGNIEKALSIFKKKTAPIVMEVREREFYEKPTEKRNRQKRVARNKELKRQRENQ